MKYVSKSLEETEKIAIRVIEEIEKLEKNFVVVGLAGDLGSGKTTLVQFIAKKWGVFEVVHSPTFVIRKDYNTTDPNFKKLIHMDAYRISDVELPTTGWSDILKEKDTVVFLEWPEKVGVPVDLYISCETDGKKWIYSF